MKTPISSLKHSTDRARYQLALLLIPLGLTSFAFVPQMRAACQNACLSNDNTAHGFDCSRQPCTHRERQYGHGFSSLRNNVSGDANTATGRDALLENQTGQKNTAVGYSAFSALTSGDD